MALRPNYVRDYKQIKDFNEACRTFNRDMLLYEQTEALKSIVNANTGVTQPAYNFYEPKITTPTYDIDLEDDDLTYSEKLHRDEYKRLVDKCASLEHNFEFYKSDISTFIWFTWMIGIIIMIAIPLAAPKYSVYSLAVLGVACVITFIIVSVIKYKQKQVIIQINKLQSKIDKLLKNIKK